MQPVRLLMHLQQRPQMLIRPHLTKLAAATFPSFSPIHHSAPSSTPYSFSHPVRKVFPIHSTHKSSPALFYTQSQKIFTQSASLNRFGIGRDPEDGLAVNHVSESAWALRLANENGFLSWCRNCYLSTAVGVGMEAEGSNIASCAYQAVFLVAGLNLTIGTSIFIFNILKLRHQIGLSPLGVAGFVGGASIHYCFWLCGLLAYAWYIWNDADLSDSKLKIRAKKKAIHDL